MGYSDITNFYQTEFAMKKIHDYSIFEMNEMYPFERDFHMSLIIKQIEEENKRKR